MDTIIIVMEIQNNKNQCQITIRIFGMKIKAREKKAKSSFFNFCFLGLFLD